MSRRVARPYAAALYQVMEKRGTAALRQVQGELEVVYGLFEGQPTLLRAFEVPAVPPARKRELLEEIGRLLDARPETRRLLAALSQHYRLRYLGDVVTELRRLVDDREGVVRGSVALPAPAREGQEGALTAALSAALGAEVKLESKVEPELLAGFVVRLGSRVYDGSLRAQLERFAASASRR